MRATTSFAVQGRLVYTAHHSFAGLCDKKAIAGTRSSSIQLGLAGESLRSALRKPSLV